MLPRPLPLLLLPHRLLLPLLLLPLLPLLRLLLLVYGSSGLSWARRSRTSLMSTSRTCLCERGSLWSFPSLSLSLDRSFSLLYFSLSFFLFSLFRPLSWFSLSLYFFTCSRVALSLA